jgi:hypothetical protein
MGILKHKLWRMKMMMMLMVFQTRFIRWQRNTVTGPVTEWLEKNDDYRFSGQK